MHGDESHDRSDAIAIFLDLDTVLLDTHQGRYGPELTVQADLAPALARLAEVATKVFVVANPPPAGSGHVMDTNHRLDVLRSGLGHSVDQFDVIACSHGENGACDCAKPGNGLSRSALTENGLDRHRGWYLGGDQEGMVSGRTAGLQTIRIGPQGSDHLSDVHRPDHAARDLMDAANRIMMETLAAD